jgi:hypothetical protein
MVHAQETRRPHLDAMVDDKDADVGRAKRETKVLEEETFERTF